MNGALQEIDYAAAKAWRWHSTTTEYQLLHHVDTKNLLFSYRPPNSRDWTSVVTLGPEWTVASGTHEEAKDLAEKFMDRMNLAS